MPRISGSQARSWERTTTYNLTRLKTPLTFKSSVLILFQSSKLSNGPPQLDAAFATKMSTFPPLTPSTTLTSRSISSVWPTFAGIEMALPLIPGSALSFSAAASVFFLSRAVMMTLSQPACSRAVAA